MYLTLHRSGRCLEAASVETRPYTIIPGTIGTMVPDRLQPEKGVRFMYSLDERDRVGQTGRPSLDNGELLFQVGRGSLSW